TLRGLKSRSAAVGSVVSSLHCMNDPQPEGHMAGFIGRRKFLATLVGGAAAALPAVSRIARAQTYPSRPITIVAPFPAGGATDIVSRTLAEGMKAPLGQTILVENVTGASGTIGSGRVVRAEPDGYTLVIGQWSSHVGAGALYRLPYHVLHDFEPISVLTTSPLWILGKNDLPAKDLK